MNRKARYIHEVERKDQILQTEATTLSAQLTPYQVCIVFYLNRNTFRSSILQSSPFLFIGFRGVA